MNWQKKYQTVTGIVGIKQKITYIPEGIIEDIDSMSSSCGCSYPRLIDNKIEVSYTPGPIPIHMQHRGFYNTTKTITITYKDGSHDLLSFKATVNKK